MGPTGKAIDEIMYEIPREILELAFVDHDVRNSPWLQQHVSIETMLREQIIQRRVRRDLNLIGGAEIRVPLSGLEPKLVESYAEVYTIPMELTGGREIIQPLNVSYGQNGGFGYNYGMSQYSGFLGSEPGRSAVSNQVIGVMASHSPIPLVSTDNVTLIAPNTILVRDVVAKTPHSWLICLVANSGEMENIQPAYYGFIAELSVLACKAFIYTKLRVGIDQGQLMAGQELGVIREVISEYADANQTYRELLKEKGGKLMFMNDRKRHARDLRSRVGGLN